jgi:hypothetical protein
MTKIALDRTAAQRSDLQEGVSSFDPLERLELTAPELDPAKARAIAAQLALAGLKKGRASIVLAAKEMAQRTQQARPRPPEPRLTTDGFMGEPRSSLR